ncbi:MAG TPA: hypothetical protein DDY68_02435, partial [Porphyromonadaceae bacterium]|nr:hypothetical protein [Porphyromonadaceae bacterium]
LYECPNGMIKPYGEEGKMMQTSTNWGVIKMEEGNCFISIMSRSFITEELKELVSRIVSCFNTISSANIEVKESYMPWKPNKDSSLLQTAQSLYKRKYEEEPKVSITPGGLECGVFISKNKDMEIISIGPTMRDIHSPKEMLSISSTQR